MVSWRAHLFARKAEGDIPDLSWRELWFMTHVRGGFGLEDFVRQGFSLEGAVENPLSQMMIIKTANGSSANAARSAMVTRNRGVCTAA